MATSVGYATDSVNKVSDGTILVRTRDPHLGVGSPMSLSVMTTVECMCTSSAEGGKIVAKNV